MTDVQEDTPQLADLVRRFRVCWEVWPEDTFVGSEKRQVGFALELSGTHPPGTARVKPGCDHCRRVFKALRRIADHIVPRELRPSISEIGPYDQAIHYSPVRESRPEVALTIRILHQARIDDPLDECEVRCLSEMKQRLQELGAQEHHWIPLKEG